jgi:hypothetical protein
MDRNVAPKRPWLAAGLTFLVIGLGHVYLRRWGRAFGWFGMLVLSTLLFGPESTGQASFWNVTPMVLVGILSVIDAYMVAYHRNLQSQVTMAERCPSCYRELDAKLSFCGWCGTELPLSPDQYQRAIEETATGEEGR